MICIEGPHVKVFDPIASINKVQCSTLTKRYSKNSVLKKPQVRAALKKSFPILACNVGQAIQVFKG